MPRIQHAIKIEGIGDASASTATDKRYRWAYYDRAAFANKSTVDPDSLYRAGLQMWPGELSIDVDFRAGTVARSSLDFRLRGTDEIFRLLYTLRHLFTAKIIADMDATQTTIDLSAQWTADVLFLEREAMGLDTSSETAISGGYRYTVVRGALETDATAHGSEATDDVFCFDACHVLAGRVIELVSIPLDGSTAYDETVLWSGVIRDITTGNAGVTIEIAADDLLGLLDRTQILKDRAQGVCAGARLESGRPQGDQLLLFLKGDRAPAAGSQVSSDPPRALFMVGDLVGRGQWSNSPSTPGQFNGRVRGSSRTFAGRQLPDDLSELAGQGWREVFCTRSDSPSNVDAASTGNGTLPLSSHPGKLLLQLLTTTPNDGAAGPNGTYDTGINALAGRIPARLVDTEGILAWGDEIGVTFDDLWLGLDDGPLPLGAFIQELLVPLLSALVPTRDGKLTVARMSDQQIYGSTLAIGQSDLATPEIVHARTLFGAVDTVSVQYNVRPGLEPDRITAQDVVKYRRQPPGEAQSTERILRGVSSRPVAMSIIQQLIGRFHDPIPLVFLSLFATKQFEFGDVVAVTNDKIFAGDGTRGLTDHPMLVVSRQEVFEDESHIIVYGLLDVGLIHTRSGWIAPSATVAASPAPTTTVITVNANDYTDPTAGPISTDAAGFAAGDFIDLVDQYGTPRATAKKIDSVVGSVITVLAGFGVTPAAGDIIRPTAYANCITTQQSDWVFVARAAGDLNGDDAKTYRI